MLLLVLGVVAAGCAKRPATTSVAAPPPSAPAPAAPPATPAPAPSTPAPAAPVPSTPSTPAPAPAPAATTARPAPAEFASIPELKDIHFDFDKYDVRPDAARTLDANAAWLKSNGNQLLLIEGHCDERGTNEYNLALGERRAKSAMNYLVSQGVQASRITIISYGEERPLCTEHTETCWAQNRRDHFLVKPR
ncbi:MAG: peptidoglycan-associated lipoprotein [Candidatus Rokubacteria bacterium 13_1_20CM_2_69_58]|nr:MAG: peptidoglycan-associated lipoprotein [Candidatus Rokubacteria bacterium 13_1_40CM_2_70_45]OLE46581.1 MAG: peptidoglycan-associated lipoprotein [Candidatus Rokubacteria bacterium 13_1_20CM_2_69_58]